MKDIIIIKCNLHMYTKFVYFLTFYYVIETFSNSKIMRKIINLQEYITIIDFNNIIKTVKFKKFIQ